MNDPKCCYELKSSNTVTGWKATNKGNAKLSIPKTYLCCDETFFVLTLSTGVTYYCSN